MSKGRRGLEGAHNMSAVNCQTMRCVVIFVALLAACDGEPGLLGEYAAAIAAKHKAAHEPDAGVPSEEAIADAAAPSAPADPVPMQPTTPPPMQPTTPPTTPPTQPTTPPPAQPARAPDLVATGDRPSPLDFGYEAYHCVSTDLVVTEDTWITAIEVAPQHAEYALRAIVSVSRQGVCDALGISAEAVFAYRPNNRRIEFPEGDAMLLPARSRIAVQVHIDTTQATEASTDTTRTEVRLWTLPKGERPQRQVVRTTFNAFNISIPVDAVDVTVSTSAAIDTRPGMEIIGYAPELGYLGQRMYGDVVATDGTSTTLFDFQDWSIDARKDYLLEPGKYLSIGTGASLEHSCVYSNRLEDQKLDANGDPMEPQLATFGEDTRQEMCAVSLYVRHPL
jgi:hypothetical protein